MPPFHGGGEMIMLVHLDRSTYKDPPYKFEAGTPNIADCIVWGEAVDYLQTIGMPAVREHEMQLTHYAMRPLSEIPGLRLFGPERPQPRGGCGRPGGRSPGGPEDVLAEANARWELIEPAMALDDLYREVILDHYSHPRNKGELPDPDIKVEGANPLCGDELSIYVKLDGGRVADVRFVGRGCSISQASASMMTEQIKGKTGA